MFSLGGLRFSLELWSRTQALMRYFFLALAAITIPQLVNSLQISKVTNAIACASIIFRQSV